ncbi:MAG: IS66 family transposase [Lachnospiraceae bacterium]|nr:IS66 family transposase [Lachnospiraceae bacterium]
MNPEDLRLVEIEQTKSKEELLEIIVMLKKELSGSKSYRIENDAALMAMNREFIKVQEERDRLKKENHDLKAALILANEQSKLKTKDLFGRSSEKLLDLTDTDPEIEEIDEAETDIIDFYMAKEKIHYDRGNIRHTVKKIAGKRKELLDRLPQQDRFLLDAEALDIEYGQRNWRIAFWRRHRVVEKNPVVYYTLNTYTPVISVGLEHMLYTVPYCSILPGSYASSSLLTDIVYQKFFMAGTYYRLEHSLENFGVSISRQTMSNWLLYFSSNYFSQIQAHMHDLLMLSPYHQCDETTIRVNNDGRKAGSRSYFWVHITSELLDTHPIVEFCYELTRGTDHLRKFYEDFEGFITCDAYCSYRILGEENMNVIIICGCAMHMRRRYAQSLALIDKSAMTDDEIDQLIEVKALGLIGQIYDADEKLKTYAADERKAKRDTLVRPLVEAYYEYIESLDTDAPEMSNRLRDAISYSLNQKEYLCRFLQDGNVPIDDGATERHIRSLAIARNNFLFCSSVKGAEAVATMFTVIETAKANKANVYLYLKYIFDEISKHVYNKKFENLEDMMPWSDAFIRYEQSHRDMLVPDASPNEYRERPKIPPKIPNEGISA